MTKSFEEFSNIYGIKSQKRKQLLHDLLYSHDNYSTLSEQRGLHYQILRNRAQRLIRSFNVSKRYELQAVYIEFLEKRLGK